MEHIGTDRYFYANMHNGGTVGYPNFNCRQHQGIASASSDADAAALWFQFGEWCVMCVPCAFAAECRWDSVASATCLALTPSCWLWLAGWVRPPANSGVAGGWARGRLDL